MSAFLDNPSTLTKEKLKSELVANKVALPAGDQRKDVYVQLYLEHLTVRNRGTPDFSSDEERESTPMRGRGRPPGRKATKKTDKPTVEEKSDKIDQDVTELTTEALKEELLKYGVKPGPILDNTRRVYEQRLLKLKEQQQITSTAPTIADFLVADNNKQNGNTDSGQYSDNEEPKIDLTFETREPLRSKTKSQVTSRSRKLEQNETAEDTEVVSELNVKRNSRLPPKDFITEIEEFSMILLNISGDAVSELPRMLEPEKGGRLQAVSKESTRVARRTPRKRVVAAEPLPSDDADISVTAPVTETILPSSNKIVANAAYSHFESRQVDYQVTESFKHTNALRSVSEFTDLSRRTPKKQLISEKHLNLLQLTDAGSLKKVIDVDIIGQTNSSDLLNTALIEDTGDISEDHMETSKKTRQLKITKFVTPLKRQIVEKSFAEEKREDKDILKEMFPYEVATPTGISASCRRPIKGAAGRPLSHRDFEMEDRTYTSKYVSKYQPVVEEKTTKMKTGRSIPMWLKIIFFVIVAVLLCLVYQAMETNEGNPFSQLLQGNENLSNDEN